MVVGAEEVTPRKRKVQAWYICALIHYQGKQDDSDLWTVGLLRRSVTIDGLVSKWEFIENLDWNSAQDVLKDSRTRLVRCTPGDLKKLMPNG